MRRIRGCHGPGYAVVLLILASTLTSAQAAPITIPGYTVTDLGPGTPTFSTDANGNGVLNAPNGQVYAFSQTPNTVLTPGQGIMANFPLLVPAPINDPFTYGNPMNAFAFVESAVMNANGLATVTESWGVAGHYENSSAYAVQLGPNGSWGSPVALWNGNEQFFTNWGPNLITGVNNLNQVLGTMAAGSVFNTGTDLVLYNINSHTLTDLNTLLGSGSGGIYQSGGDYVVNQTSAGPGQPIALDDEGRILLSAYPFPQSLPGNQPTNLLLTPNGLSAAPLEVPAPEPGALGVGLLAIAGFVAHRIREQRRER